MPLIIYHLIFKFPVVELLLVSTRRLDFRRFLESGLCPPREEGRSAGPFPGQRLVIKPNVHKVDSCLKVTYQYFIPLLVSSLLLNCSIKILNFQDSLVSYVYVIMNILKIPYTIGGF